jgi:hypothetical protein
MTIIITIITVGNYFRGVIDENHEIMAPMFILAGINSSTNLESSTSIHTPSPT